MTNRASERALASAVAALAVVASPLARADPPGPRAWVTDDGARIRREELGKAPVGSEEHRIWRPGEPVHLSALRGEVVAFQVIVEASTERLAGVSVDLGPFAPREGAPGGATPRAQRFVEHYLEVKARSRNDRRREESLGWAPAARPADADTLGWVPDALIPIEIAPRWASYPLEIAPRSNGAVWVDVHVPVDARAGESRAHLVVSAGQKSLLETDVALEVRDAELPYRPVSFFVYYDPERSLKRIGDVSVAERQLWQLLHAHHVDALGTILSRDDVARLRPALDGSLFTAKEGYEGPGAGVPPAVVALGVYGQLGDPGPEAMAAVDEIASVLPRTDADVFVYAIDEQCESPRGPAWRRLLQASAHAGRIRAAHTCDEDPRKQDVDITVMPSQAFEEAPALAARASGKSVWVYNGWLPRSGAMEIDSPNVGLLVDGWIAASRPIGRWFLWEVTFWHDKNRGGHGPIDPFVEPENFHNQDGDSCLGEGLLVYPGTQAPPFDGHSLGLTGVIPSMRLKMLRRGIQDAGYYALARATAPEAADRIVAGVLPRALDEVSLDAAVPWPTDGATYAAARDSLRALVPAGQKLDAAGVARALDGGHAARPRPLRWPLGPRRTLAAGAAAVVALLGGAMIWIRRRRAKTR